MKRIVFGLLLVAAATGCGGVLRLESDRSLYPGASWLSPRPPLGSVEVRITADKRPVAEHGRSGYLETNYLSAEQLGRPGIEVFHDLLIREIDRSGLFRPVPPSPQRGRFRLAVEVLHFFGSSNGGIGDVLVFLPTVIIEAGVRFRAALVDDEGRRYLDRDYAESRRTTTVGFAARDRTAAGLLGECAATAFDRLLADIDSAVTSFWESIDRSARESAPASRPVHCRGARPRNVTPRARRSSSARRRNAPRTPCDWQCGSGDRVTNAA